MSFITANDLGNEAKEIMRKISNTLVMQDNDTKEKNLRVFKEMFLALYEDATTNKLKYAKSLQTLIFFSGVVLGIIVM